MKRSIALFIGLMFLLQSCQKDTKPSLSNGELLQALGGQVFEITMPSDLKSDDFAGLAIKYSDGSIVPFGGSSGWKPELAMKVVCFGPENGQLSYAFFQGDGVEKASISNFPKSEISSPNPKRTGLSEGQMLIRYSREGSLGHSSNPEGDDFHLIFHVQKRK